MKEILTRLINHENLDEKNLKKFLLIFQWENIIMNRLLHF